MINSKRVRLYFYILVRRDSIEISTKLGIMDNPADIDLWTKRLGKIIMTFMSFSDVWIVILILTIISFRRAHKKSSKTISLTRVQTLSWSNSFFLFQHHVYNTSINYVIYNLIQKCISLLHIHICIHKLVLKAYFIHIVTCLIEILYLRSF